MQGLEEYLKNKDEDEIDKSTEIDNEFVLIKMDVDEAYTNKVELDPTWKDWPLRSTSTGSWMKRRFVSCRSKSLTCLWCCPWTTTTPWTWMASLLRQGPVKIANCSQAMAEIMYQIKYEKLQMLAEQHWDDLHHRKTEISEMNWNISPLQADIEGLKGQRDSLKATFADAKCGAVRPKWLSWNTLWGVPSRTWPSSYVSIRNPWISSWP